MGQGEGEGEGEKQGEYSFYQYSFLLRMCAVILIIIFKVYKALLFIYFAFVAHISVAASFHSHTFLIAEGFCPQRLYSVKTTSLEYLSIDVCFEELGLITF